MSGAEPGTTLDDGAAAVLRLNRRRGTTVDGVAYAYTRPDAAKFPAQFYWDSCFMALAYARVDPAAGRDEVRTLLAAQEADGHLGHTVFWDAPVRASRRPFYNLARPGDRATRTIQPPFLALAAEAVAGASGADAPAFVAEVLPGLRAHYDWLAAERDPDDEGLLWIVQPDESGCDASPKFDALVGARAAGLPGFVALVRESRRLGFRLEPIRAAGGFAVQEVLVNVAYALGLDALARLGGGETYARRARRVREALLDRCWSARHGLFLDRSPAGLLPVSTWSSLAPLALPDLPSEIAGRLVEEQVLDERRYWLPFPIPSTSAAEPAFRPHTRLLRYWRGPTWMPCSWLVQRGLLEHGWRGEAAELARRVERLVRRSGFREYYDPFTGAGMGARAFGMSTLAAVIAAAPFSTSSRG